jgi:hypothetical protein
MAVDATPPGSVVTSSRPRGSASNTMGTAIAREMITTAPRSRVVVSGLDA